MIGDRAHFAQLDNAFAPPPLQELHHYYEPVRQPDPQRYSHPRQASAAPSRPLENPNETYRVRPSPVPCKSRRPGSRRLHAGHHLANQRAHARLIPGIVSTPRFRCQPVSLSTRLQRFAYARLPDPHLTRHARLFHIAHHSRVTAPAACGGLKPPPAGRLRRANNPHLLHSTTSGSTAYTGHSLPRSGHTKTVIQPHRVPDDLDRIPIALVSCRNRHNNQSWQHHTWPTT